MQKSFVKICRDYSALIEEMLLWIEQGKATKYKNREETILKIQGYAENIARECLVAYQELKNDERHP